MSPSMTPPPPGTEVVINLKPARRSSWSYHASNGWYIGPSLKLNHCICTIMEGTGSERLTDTFRFKHHAMPMPTINGRRSGISTPNKKCKILRHLVPQLRQRTRTHLPRNPGHQRHQHLLLHPQEQGSATQTSYLWPHRLQLLPPERRTSSHPTHRRWRSHRLPWQQKHSNR